MPRLQGERSNRGMPLIVVAVVVLVVLVVLEYAGILDLLPNIGAG